MKPLLETILSRKLHDPKVVIYKWLDEHGIKNYTLNDKGEIDVDGDVDLIRCNLIEFPYYIQFGTVKGNFICSFNNLTSLKGSPKRVGRRFACNDSKLTTLEGAPNTVDDDFDCSYNDLTSLEGAPEKVGGNFICYYNQLTSLKGAPKKIGESFIGYNNKIQFTEDDVRKVCKVKDSIYV